MLKKILQPQTLPHTPPAFLWVTHAAADKPLLFPSSGRQPSAVTASRGEQAALLSASVSLSHWAVHVSARRLFVFVRKVWLHFFQKVLKIANACSFSSYIICYPHVPIDLSIYPTLQHHFLPAVLCACCFQILHLFWWHLNPMTIEGNFCPPWLSLCIYVFNQPRKEEGFRILDFWKWSLSVLWLM